MEGVTSGGGCRVINCSNLTLGQMSEVRRSLEVLPACCCNDWPKGLLWQCRRPAASADTIRNSRIPAVSPGLLNHGIG